MQEWDSELRESSQDARVQKQRRPCSRYAPASVCVVRDDRVLCPGAPWQGRDGVSLGRWQDGRLRCGSGDGVAGCTPTCHLARLTPSQPLTTLVQNRFSPLAFLDSIGWAEARRGNPEDAKSPLLRRYSIVPALPPARSAWRAVLGQHPTRPETSSGAPDDGPRILSSLGPVESSIRDYLGQQWPLTVSLTVG